MTDTDEDEQMTDKAPTPQPPAYCHAAGRNSDGDCSWSECPQLRDGEPAATGRHCPLDINQHRTELERLTVRRLRSADISQADVDWQIELEATADCLRELLTLCDEQDVMTEDMIKKAIAQGGQGGGDGT